MCDFDPIGEREDEFTRQASKQAVAARLKFVTELKYDLGFRCECALVNPKKKKKKERKKEQRDEKGKERRNERKQTSLDVQLSIRVTN